MQNKFKFIIIGGGTAGWISASFLKTYWGDSIEVVLIYDHNKPNIGVGESLTPMIYDYLSYVGITREDLIKNVNATVKLGLKFKNWLNDGSEFLNTFYEHRQKVSMYNYDTAYEIVTNTYDQGESYGNFFFENNKILKDNNAVQSLHIDANLFSKFIENKFKDNITVIDDIVVDIEKNHTTNKINNIILKRNGKYSGDFYIDASGFESVLFKKMNVNWINKSEWLPVNRCIPNPLNFNFTTQPVYTTAESTNQGWILQVPLSNRWGTGYLYCSDFISDELAYNNFDIFIQKRFNKKLDNPTKILKFSSGFWQEQWVSNCICVGLSSGFAEPLEATNIHHTIYQLFLFTELFNFKIFKYDIKLYNKIMNAFYDNIYQYLRFCYDTGRQDSEFWKYMSNNIPEEIKDLNEKIQHDIISDRGIPNPLIFTDKNFIKVAYGLKKIDKNSYFQILNQRKIYDQAKLESLYSTQIKNENSKNSIDHKTFIDQILGKSRDHFN